MISIKEHKLFFIILGGVVTAFFFTIGFPFFGDMTYISSVAHDIYFSNFSELINPNNDNGTPPLFSLYFASLWKLFGRNLFVAHLGILPFFLGLVYQFYKFSLRFVSKKASIIAIIILLLDPIFNTQFSIMGYDIAIVFFFLLGINAIYENEIH
jgi:4-amino-4-deoxy-L-arabinose transferase-like glycosyltransferase